MRKVRTFKCECCGMEFFNHSGILLNKGKKSFSCPFCESELLLPLIAE